MWRVKTKSLLAIGLAALVASACSDNSLAPDEVVAVDDDVAAASHGGYYTKGRRGRISPAKIRVIHASPDAPAVDVYLLRDSRRYYAGTYGRKSDVRKPIVIRNLAYGQATGYAKIPAGSYRVELRAAGAPANSPPAFAVGPVKIAPWSRITTIAAGLLGSSDPADKFRLLPLLDRFPRKFDGARVRVVHAGANAPTVALDLGNDGSVEVPALPRFADTGAEGVALPANTPLSVGVLAGEPLGLVGAFGIPPLPKGAEVYAIATGLLGGDPPFGLLAVTQDGALGFVFPD